jgi:hypothetical protein
VTAPRRRLPGPDLVPGELRGFRQFDLRPDGLYPLVHSENGRWSSDVEHAVCARGGEHPAPAADCRCGLYGWYLPGSATVALGPASAVISVRGRCILGDRGFRASQAHIDAVALPFRVRLSPGSAQRARAMLEATYPTTVVYDSTRRMLKDHPPDDVRGLGIDPPPDRSRGYRVAAVALWCTVLLPTYGLAAIPREAVSDAMTRWWPVVLLVAIGWQAGMVWLLSRLLSLQSTSPFGTPPRQP